MGEGLKLYETDDATALGPIAFTYASAAVPIPAGSVSDAVAFHLWNDKGGGGSAPRNVKLRVLVEVSSGVWQESGTPALDRRELRMRITGTANPDQDPEFVSPATGTWVPVGADAYFTVGDFRPNTAVYLELDYAPGIQGGSGTISKNFRIEAVYDRWADAHVSADLGVLVTGEDEFVIAPLVTASGTPDDVVHLSRDWFRTGELSRRTDAETKTLNQNDGAAAALASGEEYFALLSRPKAGGAIVATKGLKAVAGSALIPALPADSLKVATVHVAYQGGGTSVIDNTDITQLAVDGRGALGYSGASLDVTLGTVRAETGTTRVRREEGALTLDPSTTSTIYLGSDGTWGTTQLANSLAFWQVTTDGSGVTAVVDLRRYVGGTRVALKHAGNEATGTNQDFEIVTDVCSIDRLEARLATAAAGATGTTDLDVNLNGTTIFGATPPSIPAGSQTAECWPTTTVLAAGDALSLDTDVITSSGTRATGTEVVAWIY